MSKPRRLPDPCDCWARFAREQLAEGYALPPQNYMMGPCDKVIPGFTVSSTVTDARGRPLMRFIPYDFCPRCGKAYWKELEEDNGQSKE